MWTYIATALLAMASVVLGFAAGAAVGRGICRALRRQRFVAHVVSATGERSLRTLLVKRGFVFLRPIARLMLKVSAIDRAVGQLTSVFGGQDHAIGKEQALSLLLAAAIGASLVAGFLTASPVCGIAVGCCAVIGALSYLRTQSDKQYLAIRESVPEALRSMSACFRSGLSLVQTLRHASNEIGGVLGDLFGVAARRLEMGASTTEALSVLRVSGRVPELVFVSVALDVQHLSGGSIAPVLESARESVEGELELMRSLRVQTAQARLSSRIVTLMPFILIALFSLMSPDFLTPFFTSALGMGVLGLALAMEVAGIFAVRHILKTETG